MNENVDPCDDFYEFACGGFLRKTTIPDDRSSRTSFSLTQDEVDEQLKTILTEEPQPNEKKPFQLAKIFTKTCLDEAKLNEQGKIDKCCTRTFESMEKFADLLIV